MSNNALYVYGIVKFGVDLTLNEEGLTGKYVYLISNGKFSALVHECEEKPYIDKDPEKIKGLILTHNKILNRATKDFGGVIPLSFNTIIKKDKHSAEDNLKKWLKDDKERLEKIWSKIKDKREYGIRIYYEKDKSMQDIKKSEEVKKIKKTLEGKSQGLSYLLQGKVKSKINGIAQNKINQFKQAFYNNIKKVTTDIVVNVSKINIKEEKDLLLSLSVLVKKKQINEIKNFLEKIEKNGFSFYIAGPFAPYSFVENGTKH